MAIFIINISWRLMSDGVVGASDMDTENEENYKSLLKWINRI